MENQVEQDVVCAFLSSGWDVEDESIAEECSIRVHDELCSLYTRQHAKRHGRRWSYPLISSFVLQIEERRWKVQQAKETDLSELRSDGPQGSG